MTHKLLDQINTWEKKKKAEKEEELKKLDEIKFLS